MTPKFSISLQGSYPVKDYIRMAQRVENYGFDEIHVYDDLMFKPTWPLLTLIAEHTSCIQVGPGIITPQIVPATTRVISRNLMSSVEGGPYAVLPAGPEF